MGVIETLRQKARRLKSEVQVLVIAYKDRRTPWGAKVLIGITIGYLLSPIDLIPDFIPVLGLVDDLILVPCLIWLSLRLIPKEVIAEARARAQEQPAHLQKKNWVFGCLVIIFWIVSIVFLVNLFRHR